MTVTTAVLVSLLLSSLVGVASQVPPGKGPPIAIGGAAARLVMVDAVVLDPRGRPVTDIAHDEFELLEDGRAVKVEAFVAPRATADGRASRTPAPRPGVAAGDGAPTERRTLVVYVDRFLLSPRGRTMALDQIRDLARRHIEAGARVLVLSEDRGLKALTPMTAERALVEAALDTIQSWATQSPSQQDARRTLEDIRALLEAAPCDCVCMLPQVLQVIRGYATFRATEAQEAGSRLGIVVNALVGLPGPKTLVYVTEGLEQRPGIHLYDQYQTICPAVTTREFSTVLAAMQEFESSPALRDVTARANAARVSLYPLDARGMSSSFAADVSLEDRRYSPSPRSEMIRDANLTNPLQLLAEETGGFAMLRGLDPAAAMKRFDADARGRYVLGFVPGEQDGRVHRLQVRLTSRAQARRNAVIRHRQAYLRAALPERGAQRALSALFFGLEDDTLGARIEVTRAAPGAGLVRVTIAPSALKASRAAGSERARVVIALRATHGNGEPLIREKEVPFPPLDAGQTEAPFDIVVEVPLNEGAYEFAVLVEDGAGRSTARRRSLSAPGS